MITPFPHKEGTFFDLNHNVPLSFFTLYTKKLDKYHLVQEYLSGGALISLIQCEKAMPIHEYITSIFQSSINAILNGIDFLHSNKVSY